MSAENKYWTEGGLVPEAIAEIRFVYRMLGTQVFRGFVCVRVDNFVNHLKRVRGRAWESKTLNVARIVNWIV